jgi:hypothetical protein
MSMYVIASVGPATGLFESLAASIGAGAVVGGFAVGGASFALTRSRARSEGNAVGGGYFGGLVSLFALVFDILRRHFV